MVERRYEPTNKIWKTDYIWVENRITHGTTWFNGIKTGHVKFAYDLNGNTTERTEYSEYDFIVFRIKARYDNKINPVANSMIFPVDMIQKNNPVYVYIYRIEMSSFPPEYEIWYDYDSLGLPIREYRRSKYDKAIVETYDYEYIDKRSEGC